jgi:hypothetical protein
MTGCGSRLKKLPDFGRLPNLIDSRTDPINPNSVLRFTWLTSSGTNLVAACVSVPTRTYILQTAPNLVGPFSDLRGTQTNAAGNLVVLTFPTTNASGFFRLRLVTP